MSDGVLKEGEEVALLRAEVADLKWQRDGAVDQAAALLVERDELREENARLREALEALAEATERVDGLDPHQFWSCSDELKSARVALRGTKGEA